MHHEIKSLCAEKKYREAIDFVLRQENADFCKRDNLFEIGQTLLENPNLEQRNAFLTLIISQLLRLGDIESEHIGPLVSSLPDKDPFDSFIERMGEAIIRTIYLRGEEFCFCE